MKKISSADADLPKNRLGVARWLVREDNPLTARVQVNRYWARLFGRSLVFTEEDFGSQGIPPTHPQLLDWLAVQFIQDGWSPKALIRRLVTSATYRQASECSQALLQKDPTNQWFARGARFRLDAEIVRDQALAAAGLLSDKMYGAPVMPPQPEGVWQMVYNVRGDHTRWENATGENRYRRALYTFWRRTSPYPSMLTFDAGTRELCVLRRIRTNTPLQALVSLNDPAYVEAAGALATRLWNESVGNESVGNESVGNEAVGNESVGNEAVGSDSASDDTARITYGFRLIAVREPHASESKRLLELLGQAREHYREQKDQAKALIASTRQGCPDEAAPAEFAAWVVLGNVLLNLDEAFVRN